MTEKPRLVIALERLSQIDWTEVREDRYGSNLRLVRESAIRFARWARRIESCGCDTSPPFFDLAACLAPGFVGPQDDRCAEINQRAKSYIAKRVIPWFLKWESLQDDREVELVEPDPFEPLILCFERSGRPFYHHGFVHIEHSLSFEYGYTAWPQSFWDKQATDLSTLDLSQIDEVVNSRFHSKRANTGQPQSPPSADRRPTDR